MQTRQSSAYLNFRQKNATGHGGDFVVTNEVSSMQPRAMIFNSIELHPSGIAIVLRQNGNSITLTLDQLHNFTSDLCILAADMREDMRPPLEDE